MFSVPDSETGQQSAPQIQFELRPGNHSKLKRTPIESVLVENDLDFHSVGHMAITVARSIFTLTAVEVHNYNSY